MKVNRLLLIVLFVVLICLFLFVLFNFFHKVESFKEHKDFFDKPVNEQDVEGWMSLMYVEQHYDVDVNDVLGVSLSVFDKRMSVDKFCKESGRDCEEVLDELNAAKEENLQREHGD